MVAIQHRNAVFLAVLCVALVAACGWGQVPASPEPPALPSSQTPEIKTALWRGKVVRYVMRNGRPIYQGDIILDHLGVRPDSAGEAQSQISPRTLGEVYPGFFWPAVGVIYQIPYIITNGSANLTAAVAQYNKTFCGLIQWVPRTTQTDYANFIPGSL
jgi:hypothetical protein